MAPRGAVSIDCRGGNGEVALIIHPGDTGRAACLLLSPPDAGGVGVTVTVSGRRERTEAERGEHCPLYMAVDSAAYQREM
jgi:hypothetical protein